MRRVTLGRVAGVFGVKGWVKIVSHTRPADNILDYPRWWIGAANGPEAGYEAAVLDSRVQNNGIVVQLAGRDGQPIADRDIALRLVGQEIAVDHDALPPAPPGAYYWADLIGLDVVSTRGEALGRVSGLMENGAQDVLVVADGDTERLIPFVRGPIIESVDLDARRIVADWAPDY